MHAKYEVSTSNGSKVIANVKVENRQTDRQTNRQTNRQDKNNMPPIIRSGGIISLVRLWTITKFHHKKIKGMYEHNFMEILYRQISSKILLYFCR